MFIQVMRKYEFDWPDKGLIAAGCELKRPGKAITRFAVADSGEVFPVPSKGHLPIGSIKSIKKTAEIRAPPPWRLICSSQWALRRQKMKIPPTV